MYFNEASFSYFFPFYVLRLGLTEEQEIKTLMKVSQEDIVGNPSATDIDSEDIDPTEPQTSEAPTAIPDPGISENDAAKSVKEGMGIINVATPSEMGCNRRDISLQEQSNTKHHAKGSIGTLDSQLRTI